MKNFAHIIINFIIVFIFHYDSDSWFISDSLTLFDQRISHDYWSYVFLHWDAHFMPLYRIFYDIEFQVFGINFLLFSIVSYMLQAFYGFSFYIWICEIGIIKRNAYLLSLIVLTAINSVTLIYWHVAQGIIMYGFLSFFSLYFIEKYIKNSKNMFYLCVAVFLSSISALTCAEGILTPFYSSAYYMIRKQSLIDYRTYVKSFAFFIISFSPYLILSKICFPMEDSLALYWEPILKLRFFTVGLVNGILYQFPFVKYCIPEVVCYPIMIIFIYIISVIIKRSTPEYKRLIVSLILLILMTIGAVSLGRQNHGVYHAIKPFYFYFIFPVFLAILAIVFQKSSFLNKKLWKRFLVLRILVFTILIYNFLGIRIVHDKYWNRCALVLRTHKIQLDELITKSFIEKKVVLPNLKLSPFFGKMGLKSYIALFHETKLSHFKFVSLKDFSNPNFEVETMETQYIEWNRTTYNSYSSEIWVTYLNKKMTKNKHIK